MASLKILANRMKQLEQKLPQKLNKISKTVANATLKGLVQNTPVDTSQAVSNWQIGFGQANMSNLPPHFPGSGGSTKAQSSAETLFVGRINISGKRIGEELHISNGLDYIEDIDANSSKPGFKAKGLAAGREALAKAKLSL